MPFSWDQIIVPLKGMFAYENVHQKKASLRLLFYTPLIIPR